MSGAQKLMPQLPVSSSVTPCRTLLCAVGSSRNDRSLCVCRSMNPGVTARPVASMVFADSPSMRPMAAISPSLTATSAV